MQLPVKAGTRVKSDLKSDSGRYATAEKCGPPSTTATMAGPNPDYWLPCISAQLVGFSTLPLHRHRNVTSYWKAGRSRSFNP